MLSEMMRATRGHPHLPYYSLTRCLSLLSYVKRELSNYKLGIINHLLSSPSDAMTTPQWSECESHIYVQVRGVALERLKAQEVSCTARHAGSPFIIRTYMVLVRLRTAGQHFHTRTAVFFPPNEGFLHLPRSFVLFRIVPRLICAVWKIDQSFVCRGAFLLAAFVEMERGLVFNDKVDVVLKIAWLRIRSTRTGSMFYTRLIQRMI